MNYKSIIAASLVVLVGAAHGATTTVTNLVADPNAITNSSGTLLAQGTGYIAIGTFGGFTDGQIQAATDIGDIDTNFTVFGSSFNVNGGFDGIYSAEITAANDGTTYTGNIYTVIGNGATLALSTEILVFKQTALFVADPGNTDPAVLNDAGFSGNPPSGTNGTLLLGGIGAVPDQYGQPAFSTQALIPEPSAALLGALGGLLLLRRRRS